ncbi:MAG: ZapA protein [candidate division TM6 bacterium GW2011_GWF2_32_72]|nr:MAG: ZapA protein [candidate division TM6 bacterium GW2011_GWF2_32_72]
MGEQRKYTITIFANPYVLVSDETEKHLMSSASLVDSLMTEIATKVGAENVVRVAVLAAVKLASKTLKLEDKISRNNYEVELLADMIDQELKTLQKF